MLLIAILAVATEFLTDRIKQIVPFREIKGFQLVPVYALVVGVGLAVATGTDFLVALGVNALPTWFGVALTGVAASGGAELWHEFASKVRDLREDV